MYRDLQIVQIILRELKGQVHPDVLREFHVFEMRMAEEIERENRFNPTPTSTANRLEAYHNMLAAFAKHDLDRYFSIAELNAYVDKLDKFEALDEAGKEHYYLIQIADHFRAQLVNDRAYDAMYIPLHAVYLRYAEEKSGVARFGRSSTHSRLVERIVNKNDPILIVRGQPGTGKTIAMRQVLLTIASQSAQSTGKLIPVFIPLGHLRHVKAGSSDAMLRQVSEYLCKAYPKLSDASIGAQFISKRLADLLNAGRCIIIFDGMDELARKGKEYEEACETLRKFASTWTNKTTNRFVFSCREFDYPQELRINSLIISPFEWIDVRQYLKAHLPESDFLRREPEVHRLWRESRSAKFVLDNPFFLNLATRQIWDNPNDPFPVHRGPLLDSYIERIFRHDSTPRRESQSSDELIQVIEDFAFWLTETKASGVSVEWTRLRESDNGRRLAERIEACKHNSNLPYFLDVTADSTSFRHNRVREYFAARALKQRFVEPQIKAVVDPLEDESSDHYFNQICGDVWNFETLVMLASLLTNDGIAYLLTCVLDDAGERTATSYRAVLAAECLDSSSDRTNHELISQVFDSLQSCILDSQVSSIDRAECWTAIGRLDLNYSQLDQIDAMFVDDERFVREVCLNALATPANQVLTKCFPECRRLLFDAARILSVRRLFAYKQWVFAPTFRSIHLRVIYVASLVISLAIWIFFAPIAFVIVLIIQKPLFFLWVLPLVALAFASVVETFFWFNEDKRSPRAFLRAIRETKDRLNKDWFEPPSIPTRTELPLPVPDDDFDEISVAKTMVFDKDDLLAVLAGVKNYPDAQLYLERGGLLPPNASDTFVLDDSKLRNALLIEITNLAELIDESTELGYKIGRASFANLLTQVVHGQQPVLSTLAEDTVYALRRQARVRKPFEHFKYTHYHAGKNKHRADANFTLSEVLFLLKGATPHSYNCILWANELISTNVLDLAEQNGSEEWLAHSSRELLESANNLLSSDRGSLSRSAVIKAFGRIWEGVADPAMCDTAVNMAVEDLQEGHLKEVERSRTLRSLVIWVALPSIGILLVVLAFAAYFYSGQATKYEELASEQREQANIQQNEANSVANEPAPRPVVQDPAAKATQLAQDATRTQIGILICVVIVIIIVAWLVWRYVLPRVKLQMLDASSEHGLTSVLLIVSSSRSDLALRIRAVAKLPVADDPRAKKALRALVNTSTTPEALRTASWQALRQMQRRRMRRGESGETH